MMRRKNMTRSAVYPGFALAAACLVQNPAAAATSTSGPVSSDAGAGPSFVSGTQSSPPFGTSVQLGNFGNAVAGLQSANAALAAQGLVVTPSIGVQEEFTTANLGYYPNQNLGYPSQRPSFVTLINPQLTVTDQTRTVTAVANYSPYIQLYDGRAYEDSIQQSLNAMLDAALVPGSINLALRGYITEQATTGGLNPGGSILLGPNNRTMTESYSVEPSYHHFFLGAGTLDIAYVLGVTRQNGNTAFLPNSESPYFNNNNFVSQTETASFLTVPIFRRFDDEPTISATEDIGTGVLNDAHQYFASNTVRYAVMRHVLLTGSGGYENIQYQGLPPVRIDDATWSVGVEFTPAADTSLVLRYQHLYGYDAPYMRANFPLTARTSLAATYTDELTTPQQQIGANVAGSSLNAFGVPVGTTSGLPVVLANQTLSVQSNLQRQQILSVSTTTTYARDSVGLSVMREQEKVVAVSPSMSGFSQNGISGSISYTHQLTEFSNLSAYLNYSRYQSPGLGAQNFATYSTYAASLNYTRQLSPSLYANAEYIVTNQNVSGFGATNLQNSVIVGIQKTF